MNRRQMLILSFALLVPTQAQGNWWQRGQELLRDLTGGRTASSLTRAEIADGLREALRVGTDNVVSQVGRTDGFLADPAIRIPLPRDLERVRDTLARVGMSGMLDDLEVRMNRAAEAAAPRAKALFLDAIRDMTLEDAEGILRGPDDAATRYFQSRMSTPLAAEMRPIVDDTLSEAGAVRVHDDLLRRYHSIPFLPEIESDLTGHVVSRALDGVFHYLAIEEAAIRRDPAKRTTELLRKVFESTK
ncbi:DUF4197 domain-containing protein [Thioalkalivibrio denitrificans]|nr:DUF4197 domain-containing protein [Thioalkalivibrio denitrificans]